VCRTRYALISLTSSAGEHAARSLLCKRGARTLFSRQPIAAGSFNMSERYQSKLFSRSNAAVKFFQHDRLQKRRFSIRRYCSSAGSTVHAWKSLFTRRSYCSSVEKSPSQWKMLFVHAARRSRGALLPLSKLV
jgi:hypothetical protein